MAESAGGTDDYGFGALLAGEFYGSTWRGFGSRGRFWTVTHLDTKYPWGDELTPEKANYYFSHISDTTAVGHYSPAGDSPLGLVDMSGNVAEWTSSKLSSESDKYVNKGGGYASGKTQLEVSYRPSDLGSPAPEDQLYYQGFRCAK